MPYDFVVSSNEQTLVFTHCARPVSHKSSDPPTRRNVIMMVSDGFGPASETYGRTFYQFINDFPYDYQLPLDTILVGTSRTRSSSSWVTDSAAGATAFSCARKSYNGAISVDPFKNPCGTVLESAKIRHGMLTGLVATSRITHATPASFSAHVEDRDMEDEIAQQQLGDYPLGRVVDLMFGGGYCHFLGNTTDGSCRRDDRDLWSEASKYGWNKQITTKKEFDELEVDSKNIPAMGLFTLDHMSYDIDRDPSLEPSLKEMADKALQLLTKATEGKKKGFFLMIEGSRIDMAAHSNDPGAHAHDILSYQATIALVKEYVDAHPDTVMISTSDHETGGLTLGRQVSEAYPEYIWYPDVVARVRNSTVVLAKALKHTLPSDRSVFIRNEILKERLGIDDPTKEELAYLDEEHPTSDVDEFLGKMVSVRAQLGWTTHGHSAVDVNLYAYGLDFELLRGNHENTQIGDFISNFLELDLDDITKRLNIDNATFHLTHLTEEQKLAFTDGLDHYHKGHINHKGKGH
ncbi:alkaline phosphatase [Endogone sp. FLAS-F59071]|nr:alkaline phosphatase [Endogone sp. FLAS-F59071]|eukprot:RUS20101.1 alkaline phosphatase [Endogone sp. FLAS-F59071]